MRYIYVKGIRKVGKQSKVKGDTLWEVENKMSDRKA